MFIMLYSSSPHLPSPRLDSVGLVVVVFSIEGSVVQLDMQSTRFIPRVGQQ